MQEGWLGDCYVFGSLGGWLRKTGSDAAVPLSLSCEESLANESATFATSSHSACTPASPPRARVVRAVGRRPLRITTPLRYPSLRGPRAPASPPAARHAFTASFARPLHLDSREQRLHPGHASCRNRRLQLRTLFDGARARPLNCSASPSRALLRQTPGYSL